MSGRACRLPRFAIATLVTGLSLAVAAPVVSHAGEDDGWERGRSDVGLGLLVGGFNVGHVGGTGVGTHIDAGWNKGSWLLYGEYDFLAIGESSYEVDDPIRGRLHRLSAMLRRSVADISGSRVPLRGELWLEGGLGRQFITWNEGGRLGRNDLAFGIGAEMNIMARKDSADPHVFSIHYAVRTLIAEAPLSAKMEPPTCAGPCDEPTGPSRWDLGVFFNMGITWGR